MPKYKPVAELIAEQLFASRNRLFELVQRKIDEGKDEKEIMKEIKEGHTADPAVLSEIENVFFKKKVNAAQEAIASAPKKATKFNPYRTKEEDKKASWIDDAKVGDQVELNDEIGEVTYIGNDKIEVKTPTKTETIWKN